MRQRSSRDWGNIFSERGKRVDLQEVGKDALIGMLRMRFMLGNPDNIIEQIDALRKRLNFTTVIRRVQRPRIPYGKIMQKIELIGERIIHYFPP